MQNRNLFKSQNINIPVRRIIMRRRCHFSFRQYNNSESENSMKHTDRSEHQQGPPQDAMIDRIHGLSLQEQSMIYAVKDYLEFHLDTDESVNSSCRTKIVKWLYTVVDVTKIKRETVPIAMTYVDRLLSTSSNDFVNGILENRSKYQLLVITCHYIAVKVHSLHVLTPAIIEKISRGQYSEQDIVEQEQTILTALDWHLNGPTAVEFVNHLLSLDIILPHFEESTINTISTLSKMQAELSVADQSLVSIPYSSIALASIRNAMEEIGYYSPQEWHRVLCKLSHFVRMDPFAYEINEASVISRI